MLMMSSFLLSSFSLCLSYHFILKSGVCTAVTNTVMSSSGLLVSCGENAQERGGGDGIGSVGDAKMVEGRGVRVSCFGNTDFTGR